jgi:hypothetical protein
LPNIGGSWLIFWQFSGFQLVGMLFADIDVGIVWRLRTLATSIPFGCTLQSYSLREHAGGSPAATHFLCFAKESKQRNATAGFCPSGSLWNRAQIGKWSKLAFGSDKLHFWSNLNAISEAESERNFWSATINGLNSWSVTTRQRSFKSVAVVPDELRLEVAAPMAVKADKKWNLSEPKASLFHFPLWSPLWREPRRGYITLAFLWLLSLAKQRKWLAAGLPPATLTLSN